MWVQSGIEASGGGTCARDLVRYVLCTACRAENVGQFNYCWFCGTQPFRDPDATAVRIDVGKLEARRAVVLAAMAKRPGQRRKSKIGDDFDAFLLARSGGAEAGQRRSTTMSSTGLAFSILKAMVPRGCTIGLVPAWAQTTMAPACRVAVAPSGMRPDRLIKRLFRSCAWPCGNNLAR